MPDNQGACRMLALSNNQLYVGSTANSILNKTIVIANNNANSENNENAPTTNFESEWSVLTQVSLIMCNFDYTLIGQSYISCF